MAKTKKERLTALLERAKAKRFINDFYAKNGSMPSVSEVAEAEQLTAAEVAKVDQQVLVDNLASVAGGKETVCTDWETIKDETSWNASYENGCLKKYYVWADETGSFPYKEDLWNQKAQRAANWNDIVKEDGKPVEFEDGYHYEDADGNPCVRCWDGAFYAPGAKYPWCAINTPVFQGTIRLNYADGEDVYPWGMAKRSFGRGFAIASIPGEFDESLKCDHEGNTTFNPANLTVTLVEMD